MEIGVWYDFRNPPQWKQPYPQLYNETIEQIVFAEQLGFDAVWISEHHFVEDGYVSSPLGVAAAIAVRTTRIKIGTNLLLLPLHHPLRVAEDGALVDILSDGRFRLGVGQGYKVEEFDVFGIERRERGTRLEEELEIIRRAWSGERFRYDGEHYQYEDILVTPPPVQKPHPPFFIGARSDRATRRVARFGAALLIGADNLPRQYRLFSDAWAEAGQKPVDPPAAFLCGIYLDEDPERAWASAANYAFYQQNLYRQWAGEAADFVTHAQAQALSLDEFKGMDDRSILMGNATIIGTPDECLAEIRRRRSQVPFQHLCFWARLPGMPADKALQSLELFADQVLPVLHDEYG